MAKKNEGGAKVLKSVSGARAAGVRLDLYMIGAFDSLSRKQAKKLLDGKKVSLNGKIEMMASRIVNAGDRVEVRIDPPREAPVPPQKLDTLFKDEHLLAVLKPPFIPSGETKDPGRLTAEVLAKKAHGAGLKLLHRLDRDTTGVLLFGLTGESSAAVLAEFKKREVKKTYLAIVAGKPPQTFEDSRHLKEIPGGKVATVMSGGLRAFTTFTTLAAAKGCALIEARPETGRMHQIRAQLSARGYPLLGDSLYGGAPRVRLGEEEIEVPRQMLHAWKLSFVHPATGLEVEIVAPVPEDFRELTKTLFGKTPWGKG
ncbi:RluA family pseudouridine synthase [bacterium]|nr:MAG: RluA family pseudouridine synthase [bacterium]